jgi:hypothetical protein
MASARVRVVVQGLEQFIERIIIKLTLDIVANLKRAPSEGGTPVDTGWARANWVPPIGVPFDGLAGRRDNVTGAVQGGAEASIPTYRLGRRVWISNNVPYIERLNAGSSKQAPAGFVQAAIQKAILVDLRRGLGVSGARPFGA